MLLTACGSSHEGAAHIVGLEGTLWSETMRDPQRIEYLLLPRLLGLAERAWAPIPVVNPKDSRSSDRAAHAWSVFMNQVARIALPALDADAAATYRIPAPGLQLDGRKVLVNHEYPGFALRYTSDGHDPDTNSTPVHGPIPLTAGLRVAAFSNSGRRGWIATPLP
jgi:hexosaminidase